MHNYQHDFIQFALAHHVLKFGNFTLKSGRQSPYFFNLGAFNHGHALGRLGSFYAQAIVQHGFEFDCLFGPAYKGISLAVCTAMALARDHDMNVRVAYNRKEKKTHGEGGQLVGGPLSGKVLIIDDVMTRGTAFEAVRPLIEATNATISGMILAIDRQEPGQGAKNATQDISERVGIAIHSIITLQDVVRFLEQAGTHAQELKAIKAYQQRFSNSR